MSRLPFAVLPGVLVLAFAPPPLHAQEPAPPAHVAYVEGRGMLEHDTTSEQVEPNVPLEMGDRLRTEQGRVEVLFGDGSILQLDEHTTIDVLSDSLLRQLAGRTAIIAGSARAGRLQIDTPAGSVRIAAPGEFRVGVFDEGGGPEVEIAVFRGAAELVTDRGEIAVGAGMRAIARQNDSPSGPVPFNSARFDAFDQWSQDRLAQRRGATSYRYVPAPLRPYSAVLDAYGSWNYEPTYGYVWFPHAVAGWRPYYHGRWRFYARFGWTWVGGDMWAWPTHHYGRWGISTAGSWFWIPGATWGAAWVHWAVAPGYVSWCPLAFRGGPVVPFGYAYASRSYGHYDPWQAWTVVPRDHFGGYRSVRTVAVDGRRFGPDAVRPFVLQSTGPARPYAVARGGGVTAPPRSAGDARGITARGGRMAVPRGSAVRLPGPGAGLHAGGDARDSAPVGAAEQAHAVRRAPAGAAGGSLAMASPSSRRSDSGAPLPQPPQGRAYSATMPRRPASPAATPGAPAQPRAVPRGWTPDSVPVYRGGSRTPLPPDGARGPTVNDTYRRPSPSHGDAPGPWNTPGSVPRAMPRGTPYPQPPTYQPPAARQAPAYGPGPSAWGRESATAPAHREGPPAGAPSAPPAAAPRQAPDGGGRGAAVPRGSAGGPPAGAAPAGSHRSRQR